MSKFLDLCEEYFDTRDFYEVLKVDKSATVKQIKKAYHKVSLLVHPDRVNENEKNVATEKFKVLGKIHLILTDKEKKAVYDESGDFDDENDSTFNWMDYWRSMFKKITTEDIENYEKEYVGSDTELRDIKRAYVAGKGSMDHMLEMVPFSNCDSEERIIGIVQEMVDNGEVEEYDCFFNESKKKKDRRRKKWEQESKEAEELGVTDSDLQKAIQQNHEQREKQMCNFLSDLEAKYCKSGEKKRKSIKMKDTPSPRSTKKRNTRSSK